jgi:FkbM family methyltransferase
MNMPKETGGYPFYCDLRDSISREVCFTGQYEPQETALVRSILRPGMSFVDVGANWGYFTLLAANLVGTTGRVLSLEPHPRLFSSLAANVARNDLDQVAVLQIAAANEPCTLSLAGYDENSDNYGVSRIVAESNGQQRMFRVAADSLDRILDDHAFAAVDLMKMDIEGGEAFAVKGLTKSLATHRIKRLLLELHPVQIAEHRSTVSDIVGALQKAGYIGWTIDHSPIATRRVAYQKRLKAETLLRPVDPSGQLDDWPHQLWLAPAGS